MSDIKSFAHPLRTMSYVLRVPAWVRHFEYEVDRVGLMNLALQSDGAFAQPRDMVFVLRNFTDERAIENARYFLEKQGWKCREVPQPDGSGMVQIESRKQGYVMTEEAYMHDAALFNRIAKLYGAANAGWLAGGMKSTK